jgi:hypothetical protein
MFDATPFAVSGSLSEGGAMRRRSLVLTSVLPVLVAALLLSAPAAFATSAKGQAVSAKKLSKAVHVTKKKRSSMIFTVRKSGGSKVTGYAVTDTKYFERGPNDSGYRLVSRSEAYTAFANWGGGGSCPAKLVYRRYRYHGKTRKVLSKVYFFLAGE